MQLTCTVDGTKIEVSEDEREWLLGVFDGIAGTGRMSNRGSLRVSGSPNKANDYYQKAFIVTDGGDCAWVRKEQLEEAAPEPAPAPTEDMKPRGEKAQFWLAARPEVLSHAAEREYGGTWELALREYMEIPQVETAADLAVALLRNVSGDRYTSMEIVCGVFEYGAKKYAPGNFRRAFEDMDSMRREYPSAVLRHMLARACGQDFDPESELLHSAHAACGALMLLEGEVVNG